MTQNEFLQVVSILLRCGFILKMTKQISDTPFSLWEITINRIRYLVDCFHSWLSFNLPYHMPIFMPRVDYNIPFEWLKQNSEYKWIYVNLVFQIILIFALFDQFSSGQIEKKSALFFISSPGLSLSYLFMFHYLFLRNKILKRENGKLRKMVGSRILEYNERLKQASLR